ncbi:MAG: dihydropteroate synthase [Treponema sp.]|jgi:5-methyltetrahydrofolate--homocysteine methyltransferase|nr:dihydropteroate synthase [Treponema sp.]
MIFIGEKINGTRKAIQEAILKRDRAFIEAAALEQAQAGADYLDVNAGTSPDRETDDILWLIGIVQEATDVPICIDSSSPGTLAAALGQVRRTPLVNSVNADPARLKAFLPLIREKDAPVIALALDESKTGMPKTIAERMENIRRVMEAAASYGIPEERLFIDPLVMSVATDDTAGAAVLEAIRAIRAAWPRAHITGGLSNVSFALPNRELVNRTFLTLAIAAGMDSAVVNPANKALIESLKATELILGNDRFCRAYTKAARAGFTRK